MARENCDRFQLYICNQSFLCLSCEMLPRPMYTTYTCVYTFSLKLKAEPVNILIKQVYMPISEYEDDEVEKLYDTIEEILEEDGKGDTNNIIVGDWNSVV